MLKSRKCAIETKNYGEKNGPGSEKNLMAGKENERMKSIYYPSPFPFVYTVSLSLSLPYSSCFTLSPFLRLFPSLPPAATYRAPGRPVPVARDVTAPGTPGAR